MSEGALRVKGPVSVQCDSDIDPEEQTIKAVENIM